MGLLRKILGKLLVLSIFLMFLLGLYELFIKWESNACEMTYMYEYPQYIKMKLPKKLSKDYPNYSLFVYGEGSYAENLSKGRIDGQPVLFIPGNAGSYKQVRSLASVSYQKSIEEKFSPVFNYFAIDFHEELSALYGPILYQQTRFTAEIIEYINHLYKKEVSLILVGHSMGGMVARGVFTIQSFKYHKVNCIISLATPHLTPVLVTDLSMHSYYQEVNNAWNISGNTLWKNVAVISLMGGKKDVQVRPDLGMEGPLELASTLNLWSTGVPQLWNSVDHLCIVWCKQIVLGIVRSLFDLYDRKTKTMSQNVANKKAVFGYHLGDGTIGKKYPGEETEDALNLDAEWREIMKRQFEYIHTKQSPATYLMLPMYYDDPAYEKVYIRISNPKSKTFLYSCTSIAYISNKRICDRGQIILKNLTMFSFGGVKHLVAMIDRSALPSDKSPYVLVHLPKANSDTSVFIDIHRQIERISEFLVPIYSLWWSTMPLISPLTDTVYHNISLTHLDALWRGLHITVLSTHCQDKSPGFLIFSTPWNNYKQFYPLKPGVSTFPVMLESPKPADATDPELHLHLNRECSYTFGVTLSMSSIWSQLIRYHAPGLACVLVVFSLLVLHGQLKGCKSEGRIISFMESISKMKAYRVVLPGIFFRIFIREKFIGTYLMSIIPPHDFVLTASRNMNIMLLGQSFGAVTSVLLQIFGAAFWLSILFCGKLVSNVISRFIKKSVPLSDTLIDTTFSFTLSKFPVAISIGLIAFSLSSCGAAGILLGFLCYFYKCVKLFEDYMQEAVIKYPFLKNDETAKDTRTKLTSQLNFHITLSFLWLLCVALNLPSLIFWAQNVTYNVALPNDPSIYSAVILLSSAAVLWQDSTPNLRLNYHILHTLVFWIDVFTLLYCFYSFYRLSYVISLVMFLLAIHQIVSPVTSEDTPSQESESHANETS